MDKAPATAAKPPKSSTSLLQLLTRRSTKVEPAAQQDDLTTTTTATAPTSNGIDNRLLGSGDHHTSSTSPHYTKHNNNSVNVQSAHSSPINQFRQSYLRRHSSTQNISAIVRDPAGNSAALRKTAATGGIAKKTKALNNRFSHQFTLCCSFHDDRICTPPVSVRYNSLAPPQNGGSLLKPVPADVSLSAVSSNGSVVHSPDLRSNVSGTSSNATGSTSTTTTTVVTVHQAQQPDVTTPPAAPLSLAASALNNSRSNNDSSSDAESPLSLGVQKSSTEPNTPAKQQAAVLDSDSDGVVVPTSNAQRRRFVSATKTNPPVFKEFQPTSSAASSASGAATTSIAMSACRSRLRQKLLPPAGGSLDLPSSRFSSPPSMDDEQQQDQHTRHNPQKQQHFSSPDIVLHQRRDNRSDDAATDSFDTESVLQAATEEAVAANRSLSYDVLTGVKRPISADSLAKQSLIAAQLLNLIPAERARDRSFMAGRLAVNSLFGPVELDKVLPAREVKIYVCTWNMNGQSPPKSMTDFVLPHSIEFVPDIVVVGTQESCSLRFEWEVSLQETLGPSHILLHSATLGTLHLAVFIRRDLIWFCSVPEDASLSVRPGTAFRTKGAVAISFSLFGTSMLFVTSHLTAHQQKVKERVQDVRRIIHSLDLPRNLNVRNKNKDVTQNFDLVFWCGDLNFRLGEPREKVMKWIECTKFPLPAHLPNGYLHTDQLKSVLSNGAAFKDFKEANITFPPTYKYDPGTQHFDTSSKQRAPAYTDRILFKSKSLPMGIRRGSNLANLLNTSGQLECLAYDSVPSIVTSDHKPVWALFRSSVRPGLDSVPLAAGLFNREVYLEGMKRRLNNKNGDSSTVCAIQ